MTPQRPLRTVLSTMPPRSLASAGALVGSVARGTRRAGVLARRGDVRCWRAKDGFDAAGIAAARKAGATPTATAGSAAGANAPTLAGVRASTADAARAAVAPESHLDLFGRGVM
jgi:hypothetical protein